MTPLPRSPSLTSWAAASIEVLTAALVFAACGAGVAATAPAGATASPVAPLPAFSHVYVLVLENEGLDEIVGNPDAPYLNGVIDSYGLAEAYSAIGHPSQPNYLALFSGTTGGVTDDRSHDLSVRNLADELEAHGRSWRVYAENVPPGCFLGATASGGPDGLGTYARKHEPAISFSDISGSPVRCAKISDFSHFDGAAADYELIIPNLCHDMHDCGIVEGDRFLAGFVPRIIDSSEWRQGGVLFITFDEGKRDPGEGDKVATVVVTTAVPAGFRSTVSHTHYSLLRTVETAWGLGCLGQSCAANDLGEFFGAPSPPGDAAATAPP